MFKAAKTLLTIPNTASDRFPSEPIRSWEVAFCQRWKNLPFFTLKLLLILFFALWFARPASAQVAVDTGKYAGGTKTANTSVLISPVTFLGGDAIIVAVGLTA